MATERQRSINRRLRTAPLFEPVRLLIAISRAWNLRDAVLGGDAR